MLPEGHLLQLSEDVLKIYYSKHLIQIFPL